MIKADDILLFVQVVNVGSFSRAAEKCGLTNSVVSKRISRLESQLNVQLMYRTTRKLSLTDAGKALYGKAKVAQEVLLEAQNAVAGLGETVQGKIRVTAPAISSSLVLSDAIATFCEQYPDIDIELSVSNRFVDLIDEGYDLAIRTAQLEDSSLIARRLVGSQWQLCASPEYLAAYGTPVHPDELNTHRCLVYQVDHASTAVWHFKVAGQPYLIPVSGRFCTNNLDCLKRVTLQNAGIAYLPKVAIHEALEAGKLVPLLAEFTNKAPGIYAVFPRSKQPDKKLRLLVAHFRDAFQAQKQRFC